MYYLRFKMLENGGTLQLLLRPISPPESEAAREEVTQALRYLIDLIGAERGAFWWYDIATCSLRAQKVSSVAECHVYVYDGEAPYQGFYIHRDSVSALLDYEEK